MQKRFAFGQDVKLRIGGGGGGCWWGMLVGDGVS